MHRLAICSIALIVIALFPAAATAQRTSRVANSDEVRIFNLINRERSHRRLRALLWNDDLAALARSYSQKMASEHFFEHIDRSGSDVGDRARRMRIRGWERIGENLFMCSPDGDFVGLSVRGWMRSSSHRENILDAGWTETGIGVAYARNGDIYVTQVFADQS